MTGRPSQMTYRPWQMTGRPMHDLEVIEMSIQKKCDDLMSEKTKLHNVHIGCIKLVTQL